MLKTLIAEMGGWSWMAFGLALLVLEITAPGTFFLWFGVAAMIVGLLTFFLDGVVFWGWQGQLVAFVVISIVLVVVGRRFMARHVFEENDAPLLNERARQIIGREAILTEPITQGVGRIKLGDTVWRVTGDDAPAGTKVRVTGKDAGTMLTVENC